MFGEWDFLASLRIERIARAFKANILHAHTSHAHTLALRAHKWLRGQTLMLSTRRVDFPIGKTFFSRCKYTAQPQHFIAISNGVRKALIEGGVDPNCISLAPSGVPPIDLLPREQVRATMGIPESEIAIVTVGALTDHKGHQWLIKAAPMIFESFPQARIHILGEGELRPVLEQQIKWLGLENKVILHGHIDQARAKMAGFDLYLSSSYLEGLGTAILDAMLATLPVVAAAAGGVTDSVIDGYTGRLCLAGDAQALATTTIKALNEWDASLQMAHTAYARVKTEFSDLAMAEKTFHIYQERLSQKQSFQKANRQQILLYSKTP